MTPRMPKFKMIAPLGRGGICVKYHPRVVFSFPILSFFCEIFAVLEP